MKDHNVDTILLEYENSKDDQEEPNELEMLAGIGR